MSMHLDLRFILLLVGIVDVAADTGVDCRVPGDPDTLGLGVRLGLYEILSPLGAGASGRVAEARGLA